MSYMQHVRVSPVNGIAVTWVEGGNMKDLPICGLPRADNETFIHSKPLINVQRPCCDEASPVTETVNTYDWARFLPEVLVGIDDSDEEIAASYVREAAIEFAHTAKCLIREVVLPIKKGENQFYIEPFDFERIEGMLHVVSEDGDYGCYSHSQLGLRYEFKPSTNVLTILDERINIPCQRRLKVRFWAVPTEDACQYDVVLYEMFRRQIAKRARVNYAKTVHYRDRELIRSLPREDELLRDILEAKAKAVKKSNMKLPTSSLWGGRQRGF